MKNTAPDSTTTERDEAQLCHPLQNNGPNTFPNNSMLVQIIRLGLDIQRCKGLVLQFTSRCTQCFCMTPKTLCSDNPPFQNAEAATLTLHSGMQNLVQNCVIHVHTHKTQCSFSVAHRTCMKMNIQISGRENFQSKLQYGKFVCVYCSGVPSGLNKRKFFFT